MQETADMSQIGQRAHAVRRIPTEPTTKKGKAGSDLWKRPYDLSPELAARLLRGMAENHRQRLAVFVEKGERVSMRDLLAVTDDSDVRVLSYFQGAVSRKLRRLVDDREKKVHLIGWDYDTTKWDDQHASIVDGVCYVTPETRRALQQCFGDSTTDDS